MNKLLNDLEYVRTYIEFHVIIISNKTLEDHIHKQDKTLHKLKQKILQLIFKNYLLLKLKKYRYDFHNYKKRDNNKLH